jgi:hypothetical protein
VVSTSAKVKERIFMDFALSGFFSIFPQCIFTVSSRGNRGFFPQWLLFYFSQWIFTMSPQREFSWILPSMASFLFFPEDFYRVSSREPWILLSTALHLHSPVDIVSLQERTMDFSFNGFTSSFPSGYRVSSREKHEFFLQWFYIIHSPRDIVSLQERTTDFVSNGFTFSFSNGYCVSSRENHGLCPQ